jgi:hypothetical protein
VEGGEHKVQSDWRFSELEKVSERFLKCLASWKDAKETAWWRCASDFKGMQLHTPTLACARTLTSRLAPSLPLKKSETFLRHFSLAPHYQLAPQNGLNNSSLAGWHSGTGPVAGTSNAREHLTMRATPAHIHSWPYRARWWLE